MLSDNDSDALLLPGKTLKLQLEKSKEVHSSLTSPVGITIWCLPCLLCFCMILNSDSVTWIVE